MALGDLCYVKSGTKYLIYNAAAGSLVYKSWSRLLFSAGWNKTGVKSVRQTTYADPSTLHGEALSNMQSAAWASLGSLGYYAYDRTYNLADVPPYKVSTVTCVAQLGRVTTSSLSGTATALKLEMKNDSSREISIGLIASSSDTPSNTWSDWTDSVIYTGTPTDQFLTITSGIPAFDTYMFVFVMMTNYTAIGSATDGLWIEQAGIHQTGHYWNS